MLIGSTSVNHVHTHRMPPFPASKSVPICRRSCVWALSSASFWSSRSCSCRARRFMAGKCLGKRSGNAWKMMEGRIERKSFTTMDPMEEKNGAVANRWSFMTKIASPAIWGTKSRESRNSLVQRPGFITSIFSLYGGTPQIVSRYGGFLKWGYP